jgi:hypothetical protein
MPSLPIYVSDLIPGCNNLAVLVVSQDQSAQLKYWEEMATCGEEIAVVFQLIMEILQAERFQLQFEENYNHLLSPSMRVDMTLRSLACLPLSSLVRRS